MSQGYHLQTIQIDYLMETAVTDVDDPILYHFGSTFGNVGLYYIHQFAYSAKNNNLKVSYTRHSPAWQARVERWDKCRMMELIDYGTTLSLEPSIGERLTENPFLFLIKDNLTTPTVGQILSKYASVPCALMTLARVGSRVNVSRFWSVVLGSG